MDHVVVTAIQEQPAIVGEQETTGALGAFPHTLNEDHLV